MNSVSFLLVDDLEENLLSLEALLRRDGLNLLKARSGDEALELLLRHDVALALIDVQMPGLNGFELAELMRGNERTRRVPIIFVTAGTTDSRRRFQGYEAGAVDFIQKPIEGDVLRSKADVFFQLYQQRQQIAAQRDVLEVQATALKQADKRKDEFLATLAHELRNPLAPLKQGLDILRRNPTAVEADKIRETMDRQLGHLVHLIDDLLDVSRVSQGKIQLRKQPITLREIVQQAVEASKPQIQSANHQLSVDIPAEELWIDGDQTRLSQIISNLLNNAAKYTPDGGSIALSAEGAGGVVEVQVIDNGVGIPANMREDVFQLFTQVDANLARANGGLGIGLALVKQLVELHGGSVEASSEGEGKGSLFRVRLPLMEAPQHSADDPGIAQHHEIEGRPNDALKVLIVDDNVDVAQVTGWMVEEMGHEYHLVHDGRDAVREAVAYQPDAIILDIGMPGMDGYRVCQLLRANEEVHHAFIIAQTGWGQESDKKRALDAGFDTHLTKPVPVKSLAEALQRARNP